MASRKRHWKIDAGFSTEDLRMYFGVFIMINAVGIWMIIDAFVMQKIDYPWYISVAIGGVFILIGTVMIDYFYGKYRKINKTET